MIGTLCGAAARAHSATAVIIGTPIPATTRVDHVRENVAASYGRTPDEAMTYFGWSGLFAGITESICAPMNEVDGYNKFRDLGRAKPGQ